MPCPGEVPQTPMGIVRAVMWVETFPSTKDGQRMVCGEHMGPGRNLWTQKSVTVSANNP